MTARYGIIGYPVKHSLSPAMHNAAFATLGLDAEYSVYEVSPDRLDEFLNLSADREMSGFNVTIPHKIKTKEYIERHGQLDENAVKLGAVNTVKVTSEGLSGYNTDGPGFYRSLVEDLEFDPGGRNIFILGSGGAASAVVMYLGNGPKKIYISDVDQKKASALKAHYDSYFDMERLVVVLPSDLRAVLSECELLVNATPVGMKASDGLPIDKELLHSGLSVYDLVYNRPVTALVNEAISRKLDAVTGIGMLIYQGAIAFEIWTGEKAPVHIMKTALMDALKKAGNG